MDIPNQNKLELEYVYVGVTKTAHQPTNVIAYKTKIRLTTNIFRDNPEIVNDNDSSCKGI
jgi:hypothetical protein